MLDLARPWTRIVYILIAATVGLTGGLLVFFGVDQRATFVLVVLLVLPVQFCWSRRAGGSS